ncbi:uncharacterized protein LOC134289590 [Aedes albopictus]|uniref:Reverse transcriptase domain-containing protein n=1 Tax=Aedes albopictus TaxID=7160 RepID=A0ABM2A3T3_AEDAL
MNTSIENFTAVVKDAAEVAIPRTSEQPGRKALPWWSEEIKATVKRRRRALRAVKRLPADHPGKQEALEAYRALHLQYPPAVAEGLAEYFAELVAFDRYTDSFQHRIRDLPGISNFPIPVDLNNDPLNQPFPFREQGFHPGMSNGKSSGPDNIGYPMLKHLPASAKTSFLELVNQMWRENSFLQDWRKSIVIPIPKAKINTRDPTKYRPISLTSCVGKVVERMVNRRFREKLEAENRFEHHQHAFRPGYGTDTYFAQLDHLLKEAHTEGRHADIVSLDISKAFNRHGPH